MYYLNDSHKDYEYVVYTIHNGGCPFLGQQLSDLQQVFLWMENTEKHHNRYHQPFYIDNDFYNNFYSNVGQLHYYKILRRPISDLEEFTLN